MSDKFTLKMFIYHFSKGEIENIDKVDLLAIFAGQQWHLKVVGCCRETSSAHSVDGYLVELHDKLDT